MLEVLIARALVRGLARDNSRNTSASNTSRLTLQRGKKHAVHINKKVSALLVVV